MASSLLNGCKSFLKMIFFLILSTFLLFLFAWCFDPVLNFYDHVKIDVVDKQNYVAIDRYEEGNIQKPDDVYVSVVIPCYNEEKRLPIMLDETFKYFKQWSETNDKSYEIIVVDDGSSDKSDEVAMDYFDQNQDTFRYLKLNKNQGKGAAIKLGVDQALGKYILFVDGDGATDIRDFRMLLAEMVAIQEPSAKLGGDMAVVVGSRAHLQEKSIAQREWYRTILMRGFHVFVLALCTQNVRDTQCGFKLFTNAAAKLLFSNLHLYRWAFDIEIIYLAESFHIPLAEVAVNWHEVEGSKLIRNKLDVITTSLTMARDIVCMRIAYLVGVWHYPVLGILNAQKSEL